jgi:hypothetical protein
LQENEMNDDSTPHRCVSCGHVDDAEEFELRRSDGGAETRCPGCQQDTTTEAVELCLDCGDVIETGEDHIHGQECEEHGAFCGDYPGGCPECTDIRSRDDNL